MGQFVGQELLSFFGVGVIFLIPKEDVISGSKGPGVKFTVELVCFWIGMHDNITQVVACSLTHRLMACLGNWLALPTSLVNLLRSGLAELAACLHDAQIPLSYQALNSPIPHILLQIGYPFRARAIVLLCLSLIFQF
jgi:hypothetical protein